MYSFILLNVGFLLIKSHLCSQRRNDKLLDLDKTDSFSSRHIYKWLLACTFKEKKVQKAKPHPITFQFSVVNFLIGWYGFLNFTNGDCCLHCFIH